MERLEEKHEKARADKRAERWEARKQKHQATLRNMRLLSQSRTETLNPKPETPNPKP